jgi:hypothetical protein
VKDELDAREERDSTGVLEGECGETDGISLCTEPEGHGRSPGTPGGSPLHWDRHTQHEWSEDEAP